MDGGALRGGFLLSFGHGGDVLFLIELRVGTGEETTGVLALEVKLTILNCKNEPKESWIEGKIALERSLI